MQRIFDILSQQLSCSHITSLTEPLLTLIQLSQNLYQLSHTTRIQIQQQNIAPLLTLIQAQHSL